MSKRIIFVIAIFILIILFSLPLIIDMYKFKFKPIDYLNCVKEKGMYLKNETPNGYTCAHLYSDGGKICTSNEQCEGNCLITKDTKLKKSNNSMYPEIIGGFGECQSSDRKASCYTGDYENTMSFCN